ncbi:hypothetical protein GOV10_00185 [Candidatus Woesearchaeota archaeon]|nr:hypothetical protein [Candidatus Woesearchaeota archaeon]
MSVRKLSKNEWSFEVRRALKFREQQKKQIKKSKYAYIDKVLGKWMPLPYLLGLVAAFSLFFFFGWKEFLKFFLGWIVSLTLVAGGAYYIWRRYEKLL